MSHLGVLLINLGTPEAPHPPAIRRYLRELLGDPRVLDMPAVARAALLHGVILPFRPRRSAKAYQRIWTPEGSPLLLHSQALARGLAAELGPDVPVELAMRYGQPSIAQAMRRLGDRHADDLVVVPLFPQYSSSTTGSALAEVYRLAGTLQNVPHLRVIPPFHDHPRYLDAVARGAQPHLSEFAPDHVLFSFHGLPERQLRKADPTGQTCLERADCCAELERTNRNCYRAQAYATARALSERLGLGPAQTTVAFQSRLGPTPWIRPYTDQVLRELAERGHRRLAVFCPAFTADCLETLEEIGLRGAETFAAAGGEALRLIPALNAQPAWIEALSAILAPHLGRRAHRV